MIDFDKRVLTWADFDLAAGWLANVVRTLDPRRTLGGVYGEPRGGLPLAVALSHRLGLPLVASPLACSRTVWVDDVLETGQTLRDAMASGRDLIPCVWVVKGLGWHVALGVHSVLTLPADRWVVFPWEDKALAEADRADYRRRRGLS